MSHPCQLRPVQHRLAAALDSAAAPAWDVLRVLAATSPASVPIPRVADVLAGLLPEGRGRLDELLQVQHAADELAALGVLAAEPDAVELALPAAVTAAVRRMDRQPGRWAQPTELREALLEVHRRALRTAEELATITGNWPSDR